MAKLHKLTDLACQRAKAGKHGDGGRLTLVVQASGAKSWLWYFQLNGRPRRETGAQSGIVAKWYRYFGGLADKIEGSTIPVEGPYLNYTQRVPVGVCGALTPWNHPMLIATKNG